MMLKHGHFFFPFAINRFKCTFNSFTINKLNVIQWSKSFNICNRNNQVHLSLFSYLELSIFIVLLKIFIIEPLKSFENFFASKLPKQQISQKMPQKFTSLNSILIFCITILQIQSNFNQTSELPKLFHIPNSSQTHKNWNRKIEFAYLKK
jgi:hypothetical protein